MKHRETWVWISAKFVALPKCVPSLSEVASPEPGLTDQVLRFGGVLDNEIA